MGQARDEAGNIWETDEAGNAIRLVAPASAVGQGIVTKRADPNAALDRTIKQLGIQKTIRELSKPATEAPSGYRFAANGNLEPIPGGPADKTNRGSSNKPLKESDSTALEKAVGNYELLRNSANGFQDDYSGLGSGIENAAQAVSPFPVGTPGQRDYWAQVAQLDNAVRNGQFGASLTEGEKAAYAVTTVSPSMRPDEIRRNLGRRLEILRGTLSRKVNSLKAGGYNGEQIDELTGDYAPEFVKGYKPSASETADRSTKFFGSPANDAGDSGGEMGLATGATRREADPVRQGLNARVNGMLKSGKSDQEIRAYLANAGSNASPASVSAALAFRRKNPGYKGNYSVDLESRDVPVSAAQQAFQAVGAGPLGSYATGAADALTAGKLDNIAGALGGNAEQVNAAKALLAKANWKSSLAGNVTGGALAAAGLEAGLARSGLQAATGIAGSIARNPYAADAAYGAALGSDENGIGGALAGGALGVAGGYLGNRAVSAVRGVTDPAIQRMYARGTQMSIGQALSRSGRLGGVIKNIEDTISGLPGVSVIGSARRNDSLRSFNLANARQAAEGMAPITEVGERGAEQLDQAVANAYAPLDSVRAQIDPEYTADMVATRDAGARLPGELADNARYTIGERVDTAFTPQGGITGHNFQQALRGLRGDANSLAHVPYGSDFGQVTGQAENALTGLVGRQAPEAIPVLTRANRIFRNQSVIDAAIRAGKNVRENGDALYTPAQLNTASVANATKYGGQNAATTTRRPFYQEIADAQEVLPNKVPDSGTSGRLALTSILAGGGAGAGYLGGDTKTGLAVGAGLAGLQSRLAQQLLVEAALRRSPRAIRAADALDRYGVGTALGAPLSLQLLPGQ